MLTLLLVVSCPLSRVRLLDRLDCGPPGPSVLGILQARTLEGLPFPPPSSVGRVPHQVLQVPFLLLTAPYPLPWQDADSSERIIAPMRWGLVPYWFREADLSKLQINTSNCRSDTIMEKRSFKVGAAPWAPADSPRLSRALLWTPVRRSGSHQDRGVYFSRSSVGCPLPNRRFS